MLNELMTLNLSLKRCGIVVQKNHRWIKTPARKEGFIVGINSDCQLETIEYCGKERMVELWKIAPDNMKSFPVFNFKSPIWKLHISPEDIRKLLEDKDVKQRCNKMKEVIEQSELSYNESERKNLEDRIYGYPSELYELVDCNDNKLKPLCTLIDRLHVYKENVDSFLKQLSSVAIDASLNGTVEQVDLVGDLLFGKWDKKEHKFSGEIALLLDLSDYSRFDSRIASPAMKSILNETLLVQKNDNTTNKDLCSLTGEMTIIEKEKFPNPSLPILGQTYLFSMNDEASCHYRYRKIASGIFPVGKDLSAKLMNVIEFITDKERKGKTWKSVQGNKGSKPDLLIVYLEDKPKCEINLADLLSDADESETSAGIFEEVTSKVCLALEGEEGITHESLVRIFVLKQIDPGRKQVELNASFCVSNIKAGVKEWKDASKNHPSISIPLPKKKDKVNHSKTTDCPSPSDVMRCFHYKWIRNGTEKSKVSGINLRDVYDIFLGENREAEQSAKRLLSLAVNRLLPLLLGIGGAIHSDDSKKWNQIPPENKKTTLKTVTLFSILLYKLGHKKEVYMKDAVFNVGRLLSLSDDLHMQYCKWVRKNDIPPQLIGNALMPSAVENPERALARLWSRLLVYQAWANKVQGEEYKLVKWILGQIGKVCNDLADVALPRQTTDTDKAKMLLGYLARSRNTEE
ncbi:MAG: type I-C CRISPR-associated protein Cas8c/Csd1 [Candidatus Magnetominusculus sp. LBB02]|nr:type I-C CRISPR-associated protein Cas8c/Csd1 [Candidatus Magnetominusculus sp. LBB02]